MGSGLALHEKLFHNTTDPPTGILTWPLSEVSEDGSHYRKKKNKQAAIREPEPESGSYCCHSCLWTSRELMCDTGSLSQPTAAAFSTTTFPCPQACFLAGMSKNKQKVPLTHICLPSLTCTHLIGKTNLLPEC